MTPPPNSSTPDEVSRVTSQITSRPYSRLENCDAVMVAISPTRYIIVRRDDAKKVTPVERICKRIRDLKPGDEILYNGHRETVLGVCAY